MPPDVDLLIKDFTNSVATVAMCFVRHVDELVIVVDAKLVDRFNYTISISHLPITSCVIMSQDETFWLHFFAGEAKFGRRCLVRMIGVDVYPVEKVVVKRFHHVG